MWSKTGCLCLVWPFYKVKCSVVAFPFLTCSSCFCFQTLWDERLASELSILHKHRIKALQQGVESWDASSGTDIGASYFSTSYFTSNQRALACLFVVVYLLPTMARGGQLKRRTTLSCLRFSIHAGMSTHSYSMSVSLRLAKLSGSASIRHHPFISVGEIFLLTNPREEFQPGRMKRKLNSTVMPNWRRTVGNEHNVSGIYVSFWEISSIERQSNVQISASPCVGVFKGHFQSLMLHFCPPMII